jgi:hypothetical protein
MAKLYNLVRMTTATTGAGTITLGAAVSGFLSFAGAGVANGDVVAYGIKDGANSEVGTGTYTSSGTTLTRTVTTSTNSNSAISLSGAAEVFIVARVQDFGQGHGQCTLAKSGANLSLAPYNGNRLIINGDSQVVPSGGVTLAATGLTAGTLYYIYAFMSSGTMTLEASTTTHATDSASGVEIKSGDGTRTLVGMARPIAGPAWQDAVTQRFTRGWFNRRPVAVTNVFTATRSTSSTTYVEVNSEIRCEFLCWADEVVNAAVSSWVSNATAGDGTQTSIAFDSATAEETTTNYEPVTANFKASASVSLSKEGLAEGYHYATLVGAAPNGSTSSWYIIASSPGGRTSLNVRVGS